MALLTGNYTVANLLMLNGLFGPDRWGPTWHFWFIEALVWILVAVTALLAVPPVRRWQRAAPFGFALALVAVGLLPRFDLVSVSTGPERGTPQYVFWIFALGWAVAASRHRWHRLLLSALVVATVPGFFGNGPRDAVVAVGLLAVVWLPTVPVPAVVARPVGLLASASLYVYLTQWQVYPLFDHPAVALLASLAVGVLAWLAAQRSARRWSALRASAARRMLPRLHHPRPAGARTGQLTGASLPLMMKETM
jgi:hypothetical protein